MRPRSIAFLLVLAAAGPAAAVSESDLKLTLLGDSGDEDVDIGIDDCDDEIAEERQFDGTVGGMPTGDYTVRIIWSLDGASCGGDVLDGCPSRAMDGKCGCLDEVENTSTLSEKFSLKDDVGADLCSSSGSVTIEFQLVYLTEETDDENSGTELTSADKAFVIDLTFPPAPPTAPVLAAADGALVFDGDRVDDESDVESYEICVQEVTAASEPTDAGVDDEGGGSNAQRRFPFLESQCDEVPPGGIDGRRLEGLSNDVRYRVAYATVDKAGNRGDNSPTAEGTPLEVRDFAEFYAGTWKGGERGGCAASAVTGGAASVALALGGLWILAAARVRRRSR